MTDIKSVRNTKCIGYVFL